MHWNVILLAHSMNATNSREHLHNLAITNSFEKTLACPDVLHTCTVCACAVAKHNLTVVKLAFLVDCGPLPASTVGTMTSVEGMMLAIEGLVDVDGVQSGRVCMECLAQLHEKVVPKLAVNRPYHIHDIPEAL